MIALLRCARTRLRSLGRASSELSEIRYRVTRMRSEVLALQIQADALYGEPGDDTWRDPQAVPRG